MSPQPHSLPSTWSCSGTGWASELASPSASSWSAQSQKDPILEPARDQILNSCLDYGEGMKENKAQLFSQGIW